jgi:hypothetical protein
MKIHILQKVLRLNFADKLKNTKYEKIWVEIVNQYIWYRLHFADKLIKQRTKDKVIDENDAHVYHYSADRIDIEFYRQGTRRKNMK